MQSNLWIAAGGLLGVAVLSGVAEHRRRKRIDMDKVGWVPWPLIQFLSLMGAVLAAGLAIHAFG
jgi:hypothetical protein